jgi:Secretion system C-terminal sorting domain/Concanavalin A-like lectin/glucanases superfamily
MKMKLKSILFLTMSGFTFAATSQTVPNFVPTSGLIGWWPFNVNANDESGNLNNGVLYGGATAVNYLSVGYNLNDYVVIPPSTINNLQSFTVSFKIKFNSLNITGASATNHIISGDIPGYEENFGLAYQKSVNMWRLAFNGFLYDFADANVLTNNWYCIVLKRTISGEISLFRDNVQVSSTYNNSQITNVTSLLLGQETDCFGGCFTLNQSTNAQIDNLSIHNRNLTIAEIQDLCSASTAELKNPNELKSLTLYPNPATSIITIGYDLLTLKDHSLTVLNLIGQTVFSSSTIEQSISVDVSTWSKGVYFIQLMDPSNNVIENQKIVVQ